MKNKEDNNKTIIYKQYTCLADKQKEEMNKFKPSVGFSSFSPRTEYELGVELLKKNFTKNYDK